MHLSYICDSKNVSNNGKEDNSKSTNSSIPKIDNRFKLGNKISIRDINKNNKKNLNKSVDIIITNKNKPVTKSTKNNNNNTKYLYK